MNAIDRAFIRAYEIDEHPAPAASPSGAVEQLPGVGPPLAVRSANDLSDNASTVRGPHFRIYHETTKAPTEHPGPAERRPLSTFAAPGQTVESRFRPSLEVDAFRWSAVADDLYQNHKARWRSIVDTLLAADDAGRSLIGLGGAKPGAGATTVLTCVARLLVDAGKTVAIVDGNFVNARLAAALGLAVEIGWEDVLAGRVPLAEGVIHSIGDRAALLPLVQGGEPAAEKLDAIHASVTAGVLRYHYDMVLFDLGAITDRVQGPIARRLARQCRLDGVAIITSNGERDLVRPQSLLQTAPELAAICLGVVENQARVA